MATIHVEIPELTEWEIGALKRAAAEMLVFPDGLYGDGYTSAKANGINRLVILGAIGRAGPGENDNYYCYVTTFGEAIIQMSSMNS
jgi:hypothetical protein